MITYILIGALFVVVAVLFLTLDSQKNKIAKLYTKQKKSEEEKEARDRQNNWNSFKNLCLSKKVDRETIDEFEWELYRFKFLGSAEDEFDL